MTRILVIKFAALGDFAQAFAPMEVIRKAHPTAEITLLTTPPYVRLAAASSLFDRIETDGRPRGPVEALRLIRRLRRARYARVYDLQTSASSTRLWWALLPHPPEWSGIARFGSHPQRRADRDLMHNFDRMADQLAVAGIAPFFADGAAPAANLGFAVAASLASARAAGFSSVGARFGLKAPFALIVPGASASRPEKLWPIDRYAGLARIIEARGLGVGVLGGPEQAPLAARIRVEAPAARDLTSAQCGQADFAGLGAEAVFVVGGDTGPVHMATYAGAGGVMLLSTRVSNPGHVGPRSPMRALAAPDLADVPLADVVAAIEDLLPPPP